MYTHEAPVLCCQWTRVFFSPCLLIMRCQDGTKIVSGGCDKAARLFDMNSQSSSQIAAHDAPIRVLKWVEAPNTSPILATASWDKTLKVSNLSF